ncbi:TPR-like protein [Mycena crocata]|nr:TPR-like protein [Mycena crocata]
MDLLNSLPQLWQEELNPNPAFADDEFLIQHEDGAFGYDVEISDYSRQTSVCRDQSSDSEDEENYESTDQSEVERLIEGDFDCLVDTIRFGNDEAANDFLSRDWDFDAGEENAGKRGTYVERARAPQLSHQVKYLLGQGNLAYGNGDFTEAIRIMLEVLRIEPRCRSAWVVLARCYEDRKQSQEALKLYVMAAHLSHDADEWERLAQQSRDLKCYRQALYCWGKVVTFDPDNLHAQWDRAMLARDMGDLQRARRVLLSILHKRPYDLTVLSEIRTVLVELSDLSTCTAVYKHAFEHYRAIHPTGRGHDPATNRDIPGGGFAELEILVLADLYTVAGDHTCAVDAIRQGFRWLQGRASEQYWDACDDDREYDQQGFNRVVESGSWPGMFDLDVNARHRLAIARMKMGEIEEANLHASALLAENILDYAPLFVELADTYFEEKMYTEALSIYEMLGTEASVSSCHIVLQMAACLRMLGEFRGAADVYEYEVRVLDPLHNDAKMKLAEIYEVLNEPQKALDLLSNGVQSNKRVDNLERPDTMNEPSQVSQPLSASLFDEGHILASKHRSRPSPSVGLEARKKLEGKMEEDNLKNYERIKELWPKISEAQVEKEWLLHAVKMICVFRETRQLFTRKGEYRGVFPDRSGEDREEDESRMRSRLQLDLCLSGSSSTDVPTCLFRVVHFDDWLRLLFQYCFIVTTRGQFDLAHEILVQIFHSRPYRSSHARDSIRLAIITCAIRARRFSVIVEQFRKLRFSHTANTEPFRIFVAALASGSRPADAFVVNALSIAIWRDLQLSTFGFQKSWRDFVKYTKMVGIQEGDINPQSAQEPQAKNPVLESLYGEQRLITKRYQHAITHFLHAHELCPDDPLICLCLAIAFIGRAMQCKSDNRRLMIVQGMGFLTRYRQLRQEESEGLGEVEFNFGRAFQQLGLHSYAVKHYEKVLELTETANCNCKASLAQEAAYNLSLIYAQTGAVLSAKSIYRRWLLI